MPLISNHTPLTGRAEPSEGGYRMGRGADSRLSRVASGFLISSRAHANATMILVTGGAGFIGSNFVLDWLAACDEPVVTLDKLTYAGNLANLESLAGDPRHRFVQGDIADRELVERLLGEHPIRAIVHFAAESHVDRSIHGPEDFVATNVVGTFRLLEAARAHCSGLAPADREAFRFLHVSTDEVYGTLAPDDPPFSETNQYRPNSPYAASKAASDHLVRGHHHTFGLPVVTTNCSNNYGPWQFPEKLIPLCIHRAVSGEPLPIYGDGRQVRDWLYVGDHCSAIRRALEAGKHLLLEKPIALHADQARELQRLALARGLSVAVDYEYRAVPLFMQAERLLRAGVIGTPWLVKLDWLMSSRADPSRGWNWYSQASKGGGVIGALGTHAFDMLAWLVGPVASVTALNGVSIRERPHPEGGMAPVDAEDVSLIQTQLQWQGRAEGLVPAQINLASVARNGRGFWLEIYGSEGSLVLGSANQKDYVHGFELCCSRAGDQPQLIEPDSDLAFSTTWSDGRIAPVARIQSWWAESIRSGMPMIPGLAEGVASRSACDQAAQTASGLA